MKNYYHILQVDPQAEQEVIDAAYRRLMLKYHPDVTRVEGKDSPEFLRKVQDINEAYATLSDPLQRKVYDIKREHESKFPPQPEQEPVKPPPAKKRTSAPRPSAEIITNPPPADPRPEVKPVEMDKRIIFVRCSKSFRTFKMQIGRVRGWKGPYVILGFEPIETEPTKLEKAIEIPKWQKYWLRFKGFRPGLDSDPSKAETLHTDEEVLEERLGDDALNIGDINWRGHKCPDCAGEIINPIGTNSSWAHCGICHRLMCVGSAVHEAGKTMITCPWCGVKNHIGRVISLGDKEPSPLRGEYTARQKESPKLPAASRLMLDENKKGHT